MATTTTTTTTTMIKVWAKIDNNEPEKVEIRSDSDIDDLKSELFIGNKEEKRQYYGIFNNEKLSSSARVPHNTTGERPILFVKIDENYREDNSNDRDITRITTTHLNAVSNKELTITTPITSSTQNVNEIDLAVTPSMVTTPTITTTDPHLPPHLVETIHYKNGDKYVGEINQRREPHGKGTMSWKNGRRYEGHWMNGKKDGLGVEYGANGAVNYSGEWKDDVVASSYNDDDR